MDATPEASDAELGEITRCYNLLYRRTSRHAPARVWRAITDADELSRWMGYPARVDLRVGGDYHVTFTGNPDGDLDGVIVGIEPGRRLTYAWGLSVLEWRLEPDPDGAGCRYTFLHHGMPVRGVEEEEGVGAGWHAWLDELDMLLEGRSLDAAASRARYARLCARYRSAIEAVIGPI